MRSRSTMLLRSMQQAIYTPINSGHFGLAYEAYTHFTSPIRRYPDLLVHRVIKAMLAASALPAASLPTPGEAHEKLRGGACRLAASQAKRAGPAVSRSWQAWEAAGLHCSANERRADEASRDVEAWLKCKYMREHLGEEYAGTVSACHQLRPLRHAGRAVRRGPGAHHRAGRRVLPLRRGRQELRGERTGIRYAVGTRVRVQVSRVDLDGARSTSAWCARASRLQQALAVPTDVADAAAVQALFDRAVTQPSAGSTWCSTTPASNAPAGARWKT
jgi:ribonuclease R